MKSECGKFLIGRSYGVCHLYTDYEESVMVITRTENVVTLADGRKIKVVIGVSPDDSYEEVMRLDECGSVAVGGIVRVCHLLN